MSQQEFLGTWEQISSYAPYFHDKMLKLIVVSDPVEQPDALTVSEAELHIRLASLVQQAEILDLEPGKQNDDPNKGVVGEMVADKYRKMGFKL